MIQLVKLYLCIHAEVEVEVEVASKSVARKVHKRVCTLEVCSYFFFSFRGKLMRHVLNVLNVL